MNQLKTGQFIASCRKEKSMTQAQLAEKLGITDRAVSKWETGKNLPDAALMLDLCAILEITVNELLCGERIAMENYSKKAEDMLLQMKKEKEEADRRLLKIEWVLGTTGSVAMFALIFTASFVMMPDWTRVLLILIGCAAFIPAVLVCLKIEQVAGYYQCAKCGHCYVPTYKNVNLAMHKGRTRYMKCPQCHQKSWQKKVLTNEENND